MRRPTILVTGADGQLGFELARAACPRTARWSRWIAPRSISPIPTPSSRAVRGARPQLIVNAAAYTAVDHAEKRAATRATRSMRRAPGDPGRGSEADRRGAHPLFDRLRFRRRARRRPTPRTRRPRRSTSMARASSRASARSRPSAARASCCARAGSTGCAARISC